MERCDNSKCDDVRQVVHDLNMVLAGVIASYFIRVMTSSKGAAPIYVLEGPGHSNFLSALGVSVVIASSVVLIPVFWGKYFSLLHSCKCCSLPVEVIYSFAALLLPVAALLAIIPVPPHWVNNAAWLNMHHIAIVYLLAGLSIVMLRLHWKWWCKRPSGTAAA